MTYKNIEYKFEKILNELSILFKETITKKVT